MTSNLREKMGHKNIEMKLATSLFDQRSVSFGVQQSTPAAATN